MIITIESYSWPVDRNAGDMHATLSVKIAHENISANISVSAGIDCIDRIDKAVSAIRKAAEAMNSPKTKEGLTPDFAECIEKHSS